MDPNKNFRSAATDALIAQFARQDWFSRYEFEHDIFNRLDVASADFAALDKYMDGFFGKAPNHKSYWQKQAEEQRRAELKAKEESAEKKRLARISRFDNLQRARAKTQNSKNGN
jgi:hypothetical protein